MATRHRRGSARDKWAMERQRRKEPKGRAPLPWVVFDYHRGQHPPDDYVPSDEELEQLDDAIKFGAVEVDGRMVIVTDWQTHPHRDAWLNYSRSNK